MRDPFVGNLIPQSRIDPVARKVLEFDPWQLPNRGCGFPAAIDLSSTTGWPSLVITTSSPGPSLLMLSGNFAWASSRLMLLRTASRPFRGVLCDKDNRPHVLGLAVFVRAYWWG